MSKISEQKALEAYPPHYQKLAGDGYFDMSLEKRVGYIKGYDQATKDIFNYLEANIPCGEMSSEDIRDFIIECKEYFK